MEWSSWSVAARSDASGRDSVNRKRREVAKRPIRAMPKSTVPKKVMLRDAAG